MAPPKRKPENRPLPARWKLQHGAYYYIVPKGQKADWDGKSWFRLGSTLQEAYATWGERVSAPERITNIAALLDRYLMEVVPTKAPKSQTENRRHIANLRPVFGQMALADLEPQHIYQYVDRRSAKVAAHREVETLSHAFTKAVQWGLMRAHPFKGEVRLESESSRDRYVEDWEIGEALKLPSKRQKGSVLMVQAYLRIKLLTGLRKGDILRLGIANDKPDGLHVQPGKTRKSTGKRVIYEWTAELRAAIDQAIAVRPAISPYLFCNQYGQPLFEDAKGTTKGFDDIWQRFMGRLLAETEIKERFTEHDLRAKVGSDAESLERARQLLSHADARTTQRVYRRKPERIKPAGVTE
jgi:integrase